MTIETGWFGFYTAALYGVWVPNSFWERKPRLPAALPEDRPAPAATMTAGAAAERVSTA